MSQTHLFQQQFETYSTEVFGASPQELRRSLEKADDRAIAVLVKTSTADWADQFSVLTGLTKKEVYPILGISQATVSRSRGSNAKPSLDLVDRAFQGIELFARTAALLDREQVSAWLSTPKQHLDGQAPYQLLQTATGRERLKRYLESLEAVTYG